MPPSYLGLHLWPAGQDPGHAEAEHTPEEVRVLTQMTMAPTGQSLPPNLVATAILGDPAARPGAMGRDPCAPPRGCSLALSFPFWGFLLLLN
ncbi:protein phosphatase 1, regulatory (inhibitor) subunit 14B, isoform CRA_b [Rattus norvegicus]|uniref:Protein phosphatase 1, regulatory (Inhibitor) subunit 14B, isoform CRA_b n=2 Tax=Rattus norvegicus TaxID=10116 RepID=A6HZK3_RAT|nr:protein phosphatase 1, regulatory (inhibitor) subunit 14B, isoform CRA_b [Rattus norvegicus]